MAGLVEENARDSFLEAETEATARHRVDGRSDIFGLASFLSNARRQMPFAETRCRRRLERIHNLRTARGIAGVMGVRGRNWNWICFKAITQARSRPVFDEEARDMAMIYDNSSPAAGSQADRCRLEQPATLCASTATPVPLTPPVSDNKPIKIVPRGLRSFDAQDADFFLELLRLLP